MQFQLRRKKKESWLICFLATPLILPPPMAANHNTDRGYDYYDSLSAAGIIYDCPDGIPRFSSRFGLTFNVFPPQLPIIRPLNICSSSDGLIACHDPRTNAYYVGNPELPNSFIRLPPTPRPHDPRYTNAVLNVSGFYQEHGYRLVCAVFDRGTEYNFDVYSSVDGSWLQHRRINLEYNIIRDTGVSCGTCAYWLAVAPQSVIRYNCNSPPTENRVTKIPILDWTVLVSPGIMLQLGRVGNQLGLVTFDPSSITVSLHLLEQGSLGEFFQLYQSSHLPISSPTTIVRLIRFQSFKAELFIWVNGQLFLWEENAHDRRNMWLRPVNHIAEEQAGNGLAHVITRRLPRHFPVMIQQ